MFCIYLFGVLGTKLIIPPIKKDHTNLLSQKEIHSYWDQLD